MKKDAKQDENKKNEAKTRAEREKNTSGAPTSEHARPASNVARPGRACWHDRATWHGLAVPHGTAVPCVPSTPGCGFAFSLFLFGLGCIFSGLFCFIFLGAFLG